MKKKYVFVGASGRALGMYAIPMGRDYADVAELCGVYDINVGRARVFVEKCGVDMPVYENFDKMIEETRPDYVIVTTVDAYHSDYIIRSLELGCNVITEKPMTIDDQRCNAILEAKEKYGKEVIVTFNYRFAPFKTKIRELIADGAIGDVYSVHFEWLLDRVMQLGAHGTSYFRRWNARMAKSGGLLVHKSTHHFDLINWWIGQKPAKVSAFGKLNLYGGKNKKFENTTRCSECPHASECEFYYKLNDHEIEYYKNNEEYDGYIKDNCVYADDIDIYDTMAVNVEYDGGAVLTYSLNATTAYEGWRMVINGSKGRLEATEYETGFQAKVPEDVIKIFDLNNNVTEYHVTRGGGGHGGGDERLRNMIFRDNVPDPLGHKAGTIDGAYSIIVGVAANKSIKEGKIINIKDILKF